jgi:glycosyltransferase involved in cell wall biosynthesis
MNIWLIQIGETLPVVPNIRKLRTAMVAEKLLDRGHSVLWWASAFDHFGKKWVFDSEREIDLKENLKIIALKGIGYKKNISITRYIDHHLLALRFQKRAKHLPKPDAIIVSMPPHNLAHEPVIFGRRYGIPVLVDIRDQWPDIFLNHLPFGKRLGKILLYREFLILRQALKKADGLLSMMETLLDWGLKYAEREASWKDRIFYLGYKRLVTNEQSDRIKDLLAQHQNKFIVTFIGTFESYHDPSILVDCARKLAKEEICFVLAGNGELFDKIAKKASILPNVLLPGWLNEAEISTLLRFSHVGVCPSNKEVAFFPNKSFLYLSAGLPLISAFQGDLKYLIEQHQIGFYYQPNDSNALTGYIKKLYQDKPLWFMMSTNCQKMFSEFFEADKIYEEYAEHIERVVKSARAEERYTEKAF